MTAPLDDETFPPLVSHPEHGVSIDRGEAFVLAERLDAARAGEIARASVRDSVLRPADIHQAQLAPLQHVWLPFWRVDAEADGFHLGLNTFTTGNGGQRFVLPTGGTRSRQGVFLVLARRFFPFDPSAKLTIGLDEMIPRDRAEADPSEIVEADVPRADAEREVESRLRRAIQPSTALYARFDARIRSAALCHVPIWVLRYRYAGEAARNSAPEVCFVCVSGRTGKVVASRHPSVFRAAAARVRNWFA